MPRPERPLDSDDDDLVRFAAALRLLREKAGKPTYRELSKVAHYSVTVLSEAASGKKLPSLAVTLAYVHACGGDVEEWRVLWHEVAAGTKPADPEREPPYLGLGAFQADDSDRFFGREKLVGQLLEKVAERPFVGVFGASGSGKSSLLRAGLVARRPADVFSPGPHPLRAWEASTAPLVVIDQFEEAFTLCRDEAERMAFIEAITTSERKVVIGVRSDFYGHCGRYPALVDALHDAQILVGAMSPQELRKAITEPALRAGYTVEGALVSVLEAEHAPLPLVSHALLETWRRRRGTRLTVAGYEETGGVRHALAQSAEAAYTALDPAQQDIARRIFLRLTALGEGTEDTKRRVSRDSLDDDEQTSAVLDRLARARLITLDDTGVDLTHEAVIRSWPRLSGWLTANRDGLRVHHQLTEATATWESLHRDPGTLYRGVRLALAREWAAGHDDAMSVREREFLRQSIAEEEAEHVTARRRTRRLRQLVALLTVLLVLAVTAVGFAIRAQREARDQRNIAIARKAVSDAQVLRTKDASLALQLGLTAHDLVDDQGTRDNVLSAQSGPFFTRIAAHDKDVPAISISGTLLATASWDGRARLWDITDVTKPKALGSIPTSVELNDVDLSRDGSTLAVLLEATVALYDVRDPQHPKPAGVLDAGTPSVASVHFNHDGTRAVTAHGDGTARLWDVSDIRRPREIGQLREATENVKRATFSPDGRFVAVAAGNVVSLWDLTGEPRRRGTLVGHNGQVESIAWSPDGTKMGTGDWVHVARLWDVTNPEAPVSTAELTGSTAIVWSVAFSPDGRTFAAAGDLTTRLWDVSGTRARRLAVVPGGQYAAEFTPDGGTLVISEGPQAVRLQRLRDLPLAGHENNISALDFRHDGVVLASSSWDGTAWLWRMTPEHTREPLARLTDATRILRSVVFSPDGTVLATASDDGQVRLYDVRDPAKPVLRKAFSGTSLNVASLAFAPEGHTLAVGSYRVLTLWDIRDVAAPVLLSRLDAGPAALWTMSYSPDGTLLTVTSAARTRLFEVGNPREVRELPFGFPTEQAPKGAISDDGRIIAVLAGDTAVRLLDGRGQREIGRLTGFERQAYTLSWRGDRVVSSHADGAVRYWDISDVSQPKLLTTFTGHAADAGAVAFSPDGTYIASGSNDTTVRLWDLDVRKAIERTCAHAPAPLTREQWDEHFPDVPERQVC